jgi:hypothetical protein
MKKFTLSTLILVIGMVAGLHAQILRVPSAYPTIQAAVDAANYGDTILVAPGTYLENVQMIGNDKIITLASNFILSGDTNDISNTIIDGSNPSNPNLGMVILLKNQDSTISPKISGFTLTGGTGYYKTYGGGIYVNNALPVIEYNHIQDCSITGTQPNGAGIYVGTSFGDTSDVCLINHNVIKNCTVTSATNGVEANGAGMSLNAINADIEDNRITGNTIIGNSTATGNGGGIYYFKNDSFFQHPTVIIANNEISSNNSESWQTDGGGVFLDDLLGYARYTIEGNTISYNEVSSIASNGYAVGGGISIYNPARGSVISNNIISDNVALNGASGSDRRGGGIYLERETSLVPEINPLIEKNRITGNSAYEGGGIACQALGVSLINNFISGNQAGLRAGAIYYGGNLELVMSHQNINNTITSNSVTMQGGAAGSICFDGHTTALLMNDIFYGNQADTSNEMTINLSTVKIYNCDINTEEITGTWTGENNFYADPEFIDEMAWDCWNQDAPCSNKGTEQAGGFGAPSDDIYGNPRPQDDFIDIGAVEVNMCFVGLPEVSSSQFAVRSYPNPFGSSTTFEYAVEESGMVTLEIFNQVGQKVAELINAQQTSGTYQVPWNAEGMPAGIYYYSLRSGKLFHTGKIILMK